MSRDDPDFAERLEFGFRLMQREEWPAEEETFDDDRQTDEGREYEDLDLFGGASIQVW